MYIVTGPLVPYGRKVKDLKAAVRAKDKLDGQYGASRHTYTKVEICETILRPSP